MIDTPRIPPTTPLKSPVIQALSNQNIIHNVPTSILILPKNTIIQGIVTRQDAQGNTQIRTNNGIISLRSLFALPTGSALDLRLVTIGNNFELQLVSVNGKPPSELSPLPHNAGTSAQAKSNNNDVIFRYRPAAAPQIISPTTPATTTHIQGFGEGIIFQAKFTAPKLEIIEKILQNFSIEEITGKLTQRSANISTTPALHNFINTIKPGQSFNIQILSGTIPASPVSINNPVPVPASGNITSSPAEAAINQKPIISPVQISNTIKTAYPYNSAFIASPASSSNIPDIALKIQTNTPPIPAIQLTNTALPKVTGIVIGTEKSGDVVLKTPIGIVKLQLDAPLPKDATITFTLLSLPDSAIIAQAAQSLPGAEADGLPQLLKHWQSLDDIAEILHKNDKVNADGLLRKIVPSADKNLGAALLNFISAVKTGDAKQWLGTQIVAILQRAGKGDIIEKISKEFVTLRMASSEKSNTEWQTILFPVYDGEEIHQTRMFVRHYNQDNQGDDEKENNARFVVEVELKTLGALQLDGLIRTKNNNKIFDLIIRSHHPMPDNMKNDIITIFADTLEIAGLAGHISFNQTVFDQISEHMDNFPVNPSEDIIEDDNSGSSSILT